MQKVYIALGSNIEPRLDYLQDAIDLLENHEEISIVAESYVYDTVPKGYDDQDDFYNMVIAVETTLRGEELLDICQEIEEELQRVRTIKNGPRTIDLDVVLYDDGEISETERLLVPHPRMAERAFVLFPLNEIATEVVVPGANVTVFDLKDALSETEKADVRRLDSLEKMLNA